MKQSITWPKRSTFNLLNIVDYFKKIENISKKSKIDLIDQQQGSPKVLVGNDRILAISNYYSHLPNIKSDIKKKVTECGMCVGAHLHFLGDFSFGKKPGKYPLSYKLGIVYLDRLLFEERGSKEYNQNRLSYLIGKCFKALTKKSPAGLYIGIDSNNPQSPDHFKHVCEHPFGSNRWPVKASTVFQYIINHPELITAVGKIGKIN